MEMQINQQRKLAMGGGWAIFSLVFQLVMIPGVGVNAETQGDSFEKANQLIVMIKVKFEEAETFGAGIIFGREENKLFIVTADHVVRKKNQTTQDIRVMLKTHPDVELKALLLDSHDSNQDLAILSIDTLQNTKFDACSLAMTALGDNSHLKRGSTVFPVGYPTAIPWGSPFDPDRVSQIIGDKITIQSRFIAPGHSGGALLNGKGEIVGLILADSPPLGLAVSIEKVLKVVSDWGYPIQLSFPVPNDGTALHKSAIDDNISEIRKLIMRPCADINITDTIGETPLHVAASAGSFNAVELLLVQGALVNVESLRGDTPLHVASANGNFPVVKLLVEKGAALDHKNRKYKTSLDLAFEKNKKQIALYLLKREMSLSPGDLGRTLYLAANWGWEEAVKILIAKGAEVDWSYKSLNTPLAQAVLKGFEKVAKVLLEAGADPDVTLKRSGTSLLSVAACHFSTAGCSTDNQAIVLHLLQAGATKVNSLFGSSYYQGYKGRQAIFSNAARKGWTNVVKFLLKDGGNINFKIFTITDSPLDAARKNGHEKIVLLLLETIPFVNARNEDLETPLHLAVRLNRYDHGVALVEAGADLCALDGEGETPLSLADEKMKKEIVEAFHKRNHGERISRNQKCGINK